METMVKPPTPAQLKKAAVEKELAELKEDLEQGIADAKKGIFGR